MSIGTEHEPAEREVEGSHSDGTVDLARLSWLITTFLLLAGVVVLALKRDWGYAGVTAAVALSAAINLF